MRAVGISHAQATAVSLGAGKRLTEARDFVAHNRAAIGEITEEQQIALFNRIYPGYEQRARSRYYQNTASVTNRPEWEELHGAIRGVLVDIVYQGFRAEATMPVAAQNDPEALAAFIRRTRALSRYEGNRQRAEYLIRNRDRGN